MILWILIGIASLVTVSLLAGLALAAVLGHVARQMAQLDVEQWTTSPLARDDGALREAAAPLAGRA